MLSQHLPTSPASSAAVRTKTKKVLELVLWALRERERTLRYEWAKVNPLLVRQAMKQLKAWADTHPYVSPKAAREFWQTHAATIHLVMPGNAAGKARLKELARIINTL